MAVNNQNAVLYAGDNAILNYAITDENGNPLNLTGDTLTYTISGQEGGTALVTKTTSNGITITNAAGGLLSVALLGSDTASLSGVLWQNLTMTDSVGEVSTLSTGLIAFNPVPGSIAPTPTPTPTPAGVVGFEFQTWAFMFPELATQVSPGQAAGFFARACNFVNNTPGSLIRDLPTRQTILYLIVAHLIALNTGANGQLPNGMVGRISSATEGSVSVTTELQIPGSAAWLGQTRYGYEAYQAMAPYRTFRYFAHPERAVQPWFPYGYQGFR